MEKQSFGQTSDGRTATLYTIRNSSGMSANITDYGAALHALLVPDRDGNLQDVVLGYDDVADYEQHTDYFGAMVGRNCNRIEDAKCVIDGVEYQLDDNDNGNNLHSGFQGSSRRFWSVKDFKENSITFMLEDPHLNQGFPGNAQMEVTYELTEENEMALSYHAVCDQKTVFNFTNHAYFNLDGHASGDVLDQVLQIQASAYTPVRDQRAIPTGEIAPVEGTPFDFRQAKPIGRDIHADHEQLRYGGGYDHNFAIDRTGTGMEKAATVYSPKTGIQMEVLTDCIGIQLYTANGVDGVKGKQGAVYPKHAAMCLETQYFPNSIDEPNFQTPLTEAGEAYESSTVYKFTTCRV